MTAEAAAYLVIMVDGCLVELALLGLNLAPFHAKAVARPHVNNIK